MAPTHHVPPQYQAALTSTHLPIHRVVPPIADIDSNLAIRSLKHRVTCVPLHVVRALIEVPHSRDVILHAAEERHLMRGTWCMQ